MGELLLPPLLLLIAAIRKTGENRGGKPSSLPMSVKTGKTDLEGYGIGFLRVLNNLSCVRQLKLGPGCDLVTKLAHS